MVGLGDLAGGVFSSEAYGVSADGSVVVGQSASASGAEAFRWTEGGGMVGLGDLAGGVFSSSALGVSADGSVVVGYGNSASGREAFLWDASDGMQSLRDVLIAGGATGLDDWSLTDATGVSADGRTIVGYGTNPLGEQEAWIATVPEPGTLALALSGLMLLSVFAGQQFRCRRRAAPVP
jgi:probable HAF family extracellular repeat protein